MVGASLFTGGFAIPFIASIAASCATATASNALLQKKYEEEQKEKFIEAKVKAVKEAFEYMFKDYKNSEEFTVWLGYNEPYMIGEDVKEFLEDIYICDSEEIIHLEDEVYYRWSDIEKDVREYEKRELEKV